MEQLLKTNWHNSTYEQKAVYIKKCKMVLKNCDTQSARLEVMRRIGDVYYNLRNYRMMAKWYRRVLDQDRALKTNSPIGYRLEKVEQIILRENLILFFICIYCAIGLYVIMFYLKNRQLLNMRLFMHRIGIMTPVFLVLGYIILKSDLFFTSGSLAILSDTYQHSLLINPVFPLPATDSTFLLSGILILMLGCIPILLYSFLGSFSNRNVKFLRFLPALLLILTIWSHFTLVHVYDNEMHQKAVLTASHLYVKGEIEEVMKDNPDKLFRANRDYRKSGNADLTIFLREKNISHQ